MIVIMIIIIITIIFIKESITRMAKGHAKCILKYATGFSLNLMFGVLLKFLILFQILHLM
jgi:hypothetical protein